MLFPLHRSTKVLYHHPSVTSSPPLPYHMVTDMSTVKVQECVSIPFCLFPFAIFEIFQYHLTWWLTLINMRHPPPKLHPHCIKSKSLSRFVLRWYPAVLRKFWLCAQWWLLRVLKDQIGCQESKPGQLIQGHLLNYHSGPYHNSFFHSSVDRAFKLFPHLGYCT